MNDNKEIFVNPRGGWQPQEKLEYSPIFIWPPSPTKFLKWLLKFPGYIWPWNIFYIGIAVLSYFFLPNINKCASFSLDWISVIFLRNIFLIILLAGFWHIRLHILKYQNNEFKYNINPLGKEKKQWLLGSQTRENMFWSLCSGGVIWTAYEVFMIWMYANDLFLFPLKDWLSNPIYFGLLFLLIPLWQEFHFYITHRISHWKIIYRFVHYLHHRNVNTGPWSGLSMHPFEHLFYFSTVLIHLIIPTYQILFMILKLLLNIYSKAIISIL